MNYSTILKWAKQIAENLGHNYIGTEHFLLSYLILVRHEYELAFRVYTHIINEVGKGTKTTLSFENCTSSLIKKTEMPDLSTIISSITEDEHCSAMLILKKVYLEY